MNNPTGLYGQQITLIRGDDQPFIFEFETGALADVASATVTLQRHGGEPIIVAGVIDGDQVHVLFCQETTREAGRYRADLQLCYSDGSIQTPWLLGNYGDLVIVDDVNKNLCAVVKAE